MKLLENILIQSGYGLNHKEETHIAWMVLYWNLQIYKRPKWNSELEIKTWVREFSKISSWREFEIYCEGEKIGIAISEWVAIDTLKNALSKMTDDMVEKYGICEKTAYDKKLTGRLKEPEKLEKIYEYTAKRRDLDTNNHVNNTIYLEYAYDALPEGLSLNFNNIEIYYKKQIKLGDTICCLYSNEDDTHTVVIKSADEKILHAILKFY